MKLLSATCICLFVASLANAKIYHDEGIKTQRRGSLERPSPSESKFSSIFGQSGSLRGKLKELLNVLQSPIWEDNDNFGSSFGIGSLSTKDILKHLLGSSQPWWKGPNVCKTKDDSEEDDIPNRTETSSTVTEKPKTDDDSDESDENDDGGEPVQMSSSTFCSMTPNTYKCVVKVSKNGKTKITTITYQCCHGYSRVFGKPGCAKKLELKNLIETLKDMNQTVFLRAVNDLKMEESLNSGNYTLFVPSQDALTDENGDNEIAAVVAGGEDKNSFLRGIIKGLIVDGWNTTSVMKDEQVLTTLNEDRQIRINRYYYPRPFYTANCARMTSINNKATNGIIHILNKFVMSRKESIGHVISTSKKLSKMVQTMPADVLKQLKDPKKHFTLFAFTNKAFEKLSDDLKEKINKKDSCVKDLMKYHILENTICTEAIQGRSAARTLAGTFMNLTRSRDGKVFYAEESPIVATDRIASNGVIHIVDKVFIKEKMLNALDAVTKSGAELFVDLITNNNIKSELEEIPEVTYFIPPNEKLMKLLESSDKKALKATLKAHMADGITKLSVSNPETIVKTLAKTEMTVRIRPSVFRFGRSRRVHANIQCSSIIRANVKACNGILHFINKPLQNPSKTVFDMLKSNANMSQFVMLIEAADMTDVLKKKDLDATVFAPLNDGFDDAKSKQKVKRLLVDKPKLKKFIQGHIIKKQYCCNQLGSKTFLGRASYRTIGGNRLYVFSWGYGLRVGNSHVESCDQIGTNGFIHTVNQPIESVQIRLRNFNFDDWF